MADLRFAHASDVTRQDPEAGSIGVTRLLTGKDAGTERDYKAGDEALVEAGTAEWVVAPVHTPSVGRRLDTDAEREATPADGVEAFPAAEPTTRERRAEARVEGVVDAASDKGIGAKLAGARAEQVVASSDGDAKLQAQLGSRGARSGPAGTSAEVVADAPKSASDKK